MKKLIQIIIPIKTAACYSFTVMMLFYALYAWFAGFGITPQITLSFLLISFVGGVLQCVAFSSLVIKKLSYALRLCVFVIPFFLCLLLCARFFTWVPMGVTGAWLVFFLIFAVIFIVMTVFFELYFRLTGRKYDGLLGEYQSRHNQPKA